jgi:hypothetical protein
MNMTQNLSMSRALLAAMLALGGLVGTSSLSAQSVTTAPVGAVSKTIPVGLSSLAVTLTNPNLLVASCSANSSTVLTLTGVSNAGASLTAGLPYYVEAVSGSLEGDRFDVDTAATITAANGTVVLNLASSNNTFVLTTNVAAGTQFALRQHVTLSQVQAACSAPLVGNNTASLADQIQFLNAAGNGFVSYYLRGNGTEWRQVGGLVNLNNTPVPAGTGILISKKTSPVSIVMTGSVRTNHFASPLAVGLSLKAAPYPVSYSPAGLNATQTLGWTPNNTASLADQIQVLNSSGNGFVSYYLRSNGTEWRQVGGLTAVTTNSLFPYDSGYFVSRKTSDVNYVLTAPFTL